MAEATTVGDVIESAQDLAPGIKQWFETGWHHLSNLELTELTLGQAGFTLILILFAIYIWVSLRSPW